MVTFLLPPLSHSSPPASLAQFQMASFFPTHSSHLQSMPTVLRPNKASPRPHQTNTVSSMPAALKVDAMKSIVSTELSSCFQLWCCRLNHWLCDLLFFPTYHFSLWWSNLNPDINMNPPIFHYFDLSNFLVPYPNSSKAEIPSFTRWIGNYFNCYSTNSKYCWFWLSLCIFQWFVMYDWPLGSQGSWKCTFLEHRKLFLMGSWTELIFCFRYWYQGSLF